MARGFVEQVVFILRPAVETPLDGRDFAEGIADEQRAEIARPDAVGRLPVERDRGKIGTAHGENAAGGFLDIGVIHKDADPLNVRQFADDFAEHPRNRLEAAGPVFGIVRPGDPCGGMRLPFGGHAEAERVRRAHARNRLVMGP